MAQQRRYSRLPFPTHTTIAVGPAGSARETTLIDLSLKGALLQRPPGLQAEVGATARLRIAVEQSPVVIAMEGTLAHVSSEQIGLHCRSIDVDSLLHLRRLLELNLGDPELLERELLALG